MCVRDRKSYDLCIHRLGLSTNNCFLLPDMALLRLSRINQKCQLLGKSIIFSLRDDAEKNSDTEILNGFKELIDEKGYSIVESSTAIHGKLISYKDRERIINNKINEYSDADLVITDRLHSMIFSLISGTKCIAIDISTHKISGVKEEWLTDYPGLKVFEMAGDVSYYDIVNILCSTEFPIQIDFTEKIDKLTRAIVCEIND